jgi:hypothetical protein
MSNPFDNEPIDRFEAALRAEDAEVLYRITAREDYEHGDEVGFIYHEGWSFAVCWEDGEVVKGHFAFDGEDKGFFPSGTEWMITNNNSIDYGLDS